MPVYRVRGPWFATCVDRRNDLPRHSSDRADPHPLPGSGHLPVSSGFLLTTIEQAPPADLLLRHRHGPVSGVGILMNTIARLRDSQKIRQSTRAYWIDGVVARDDQRQLAWPAGLIVLRLCRTLHWSRSARRTNAAPLQSGTVRDGSQHCGHRVHCLAVRRRRRGPSALETPARAPRRGRHGSGGARPHQVTYARSAVQHGLLATPGQ